MRPLSQGRAHERIVEEANVRVDRAAVALLYKLSVAEYGLRLTDLAARLGVDAPTVTRKVQQLEREGLLTRSADVLDRRASRLALTTEGKRTIERVLKARRRWLQSLLVGWDDDELGTFGALLERFADAINDDLENHPDGH